MNTAEAKQRAQQQKGSGDFEGAAKTLADAIANESSSEAQAELYGMIGGVRREQGNLAASVAAYDEGFRLEPVENTYNELNRLVVRILLEPRVLTDPDALQSFSQLQPVNVPMALQLLGPQIRHQIEVSRNTDYWAYGDLAFTSALTGDGDEMRDALDGMQTCAPPASAYRKYHETLGALASLETPRRELLAEAMGWLARRL